MAMAPKQKAVVAMGGIGILAYFFLGSKKASAASSKGAGTSTGGTNGTGTNEEGKGGIGEPAGPNGCKVGLIPKDGICVKDPKQQNGGGTGTGTGTGGALKPSEIYISNKCDTFKFGDKTGESWWKNSGKKKAEDWLKAGFENLTLIAFEMIRKNKETCFKDFPVQEKYKSNFELQGARIDWILKYPMMWALLHAIRNFIDRDLLNGVSYVKINNSKDPWKLEFGKSFDFNVFWEDIQPLAYYIFYNEQLKPGSMLKKVGLSYVDYDVPGNDATNSVLVLYSIIFPYILDKKVLEQKMKWLQSGNFYSTLWDHIAAMEGQSIDVGMEEA